MTTESNDELICTRCGDVIRPDERSGGLLSGPPIHHRATICFATLRSRVAALRERVAELEAQPRIEWRPVSEPPEPQGDDHRLMGLVVIEGSGYREIERAYFRDGKWLDYEAEPLDDITYWVRRSDLLPDPLRGDDMTQYERTDDKPQWIDAAERQPPDAWPRPCVCRDGAGQGTHWATRRYQGGSWWSPGQLGEEVDRHVLYWMEVYPLPDGVGPKIQEDNMYEVIDLSSGEHEGLFETIDGAIAFIHRALSNPTLNTDDDPYAIRDMYVNEYLYIFFQRKVWRPS